MHVLFLCPHGAAKSVIATAVARDLIARAGLTVTCDNAGTDPDPENSAVALDVLARHGQTFTGSPRTVTADDLRRADVVVSMGIAEQDLPARPRHFVDWSDVPDASADAVGLHAILTTRLATLLT